MSQNITELLGLREEESVRLVTGENWRECRKIHTGKGPNLCTETSPRLQAVLKSNSRQSQSRPGLEPHGSWISKGQVFHFCESRTVGRRTMMVNPLGDFLSITLCPQLAKVLIVMRHPPAVWLLYHSLLYAARFFFKTYFCVYLCFYPEFFRDSSNSFLFHNHYNFVPVTKYSIFFFTLENVKLLFIQWNSVLYIGTHVSLYIYKDDQIHVFKYYITLKGELHKNYIYIL